MCRDDSDNTKCISSSASDNDDDGKNNFMIDSKEETEELPVSGKNVDLS